MGLVSIITPIFNVAPYLAEMIDSVLRQTHGAFELLIVDDESTDDSFAIAERYASRDRRVRVWRQPKGGVVRARNAAMGKARGEWLAFLDGDDRWHPEFLEAVIAEMRGRDENCVGAFTGLRLIEANGRVLKNRRIPARRIYSPFDMLSGICPPGSSSCVVVHREMADAVGIFDESFDYAHDSEFWHRMLEPSPRRYFVAIPRTLADYRIRRPGSLTTTIGHTARESLDRINLRYLGAYAREMRARIQVGQARSLLRREEIGDALRLLWRAWNVHPRAAMREREFWAVGNEGLRRAAYLAKLRLRYGNDRAGRRS